MHEFHENVVYMHGAVVPVQTVNQMCRRQLASATLIVTNPIRPPGPLVRLPDSYRLRVVQSMGVGALAGMQSVAAVHADVISLATMTKPGGR